MRSWLRVLSACLPAPVSVWLSVCVCVYVCSWLRALSVASWEPPRHYERLSLLKSVHIFAKHKVQYETRTYFRVLELLRLTGSTADTYLEYTQRMLPEGIAMKVSRVSTSSHMHHALSGRRNNLCLRQKLNLTG